MQKTVVCQLALGRTRVSGYTLYDHDSMAFEETTPRDVKRLIKEGVVNGLRLNKQGEILLDEKGFNCKNLLVKSGVGNYRPLVPSVDMLGHGMFALTKVACTDDGLVYEIVSNECARLPITEQKLRALYSVGCLCGCWINDDTGMIEFAKGVEMLDMTTEAIQERQRLEAKMKEEERCGSDDVSFGTSADTSECDDGAYNPCCDNPCDDSCGDTEHSAEGGSDGFSGLAEERVIEKPVMAEEDAEVPYEAKETYTDQEEEEFKSLEEMLGIPAEHNKDVTQSLEAEAAIIFENLESPDVNDDNSQKMTKASKKSGKGKSKKSK